MIIRCLNEFFKTKSSDKNISIGDLVVPSESATEIREYFHGLPRRVVRIEDGPSYAGGKFVYVNIRGNEIGFYLNGLERFEL